MGLIELKVKVVNLADEAKYIRKQENKARRLGNQHKVWSRIAKLGLEPEESRRMFAELMGKKSELESKVRKHAIRQLPKDETPDPYRDTRLSLQGHRRGVVSKSARTSQLAYGFMRGVPYKTLERNVHANHVLSASDIKYVVEIVAL